MMTDEQFRSAVAEHVLRPLATFGFREAAFAPFSARLENSAVALTVDYDVHRTREVHCRLSLVEDDATSVAVDAVDMRLSTPVANGLEELDEALNRIATCLAEGHADVLAGDPEAFVDIADSLRESASDYTARVATAPTVSRADHAWHGRDYEEVARLLAPIRSQLDPTHLRRLEYALSFVERGGSR